MTMQRRQHSGEFKAKVALEAIRGERTIQELAAAYGVHPVQIAQWKKVALEELPKIFSSRRGTKHTEEEALKAALYQQIGQLKVELDWLKKKLALPVEAKRALIEPGHPQVSLRRQCALLGLVRSGWYYQPVSDSVEDLQLMRLLDEQYTATPFYGVRRMTAWLRRQGYAVNPKCLRRLLRQMGLEAIDPKPRLSQPAAGHQIYPYLLRGVTIARVHQVWSADITYIRLASGFVYLVAVMDWFSRYVLSWVISITMDGAFCLEAVEQALQQGRPVIFNTDQGAQFTSLAFTERLKKGGVQISMDGRGRALDNVFVERLWRSVKYEEVYVRDYQRVWDARQHVARSFVFYHQERLHQALGYRTPAAVYLSETAGLPEGRHLVRESTGHHEALYLNLCCPKNGLDNGEYFKQAIAELKQEGVIPLDATLTVIEIQKSSPAPLRLYRVTEGPNSRPWIENAEVGVCYIVNDAEAYLCTTGQPFLHQGTARPLHVKRVAGPLPLLHCLEDLYALTVLAWTQPEGCTRDPITLKLNDRYLRDEATDYDADALDFAESSDNEEVA